MVTHTTRLSLSSIRKLATDALAAQGFSTEQAAAIAETVTCAERDHCRSHGLFRIPFYVAALRNDDANPAANPVVTTDETSVVHVDAAHGFCPLALQAGLPSLVAMTRRRGIAAMAIHHTYNIAALWPEVEALAEDGLVAMAFTASMAYVAPAGGSRPVFGTNPMAFAWPRENGPPLVFDQASSASARGEIQLHQREGLCLPEGWAIDAEGAPTTDPAAALEGAQLPFGGYKGAGLALMIELLAGALIGDLFSIEASEHDVHDTGAPLGGEFIIAIDPARCAPHQPAGSHLARGEQLFAAILSQAGTRLPAARRHAARVESVRDGVDVATALIEELSGLTA